jgi:hypothetical protein
MQVGKGVQATYFYVITIDQLLLTFASQSRFPFLIPFFFFWGPVFRQHNLILGSDRRIRSQKKERRKNPLRLGIYLIFQKNWCRKIGEF